MTAGGRWGSAPRALASWAFAVCCELLSTWAVALALGFCVKLFKM